MHSNTVCIRRIFRISVKCFSGEKVFICCLGELICICGARRRQFYARLRLFHSLRTRRCLLCLCHFCHFYGVKLFVNMDRKVTSNIKLKKYKIVNKRSTNSLCTFLTFQTVINKLISIIIFYAEICFE